MTISLKSIVNVQLLWIQPEKCWQQWAGKSLSQTNQRWILKQTKIVNCCRSGRVWWHFWPPTGRFRQYNWYGTFWPWHWGSHSNIMFSCPRSSSSRLEHFLMNVFSEVLYWCMLNSCFRGLPTVTPLWGTSCCQTTLFLRSSRLTGGHNTTVPVC